MALSVDWTRVPGYPKENFTSEGDIRVIDQFLCAWDDRFQLTKELLGYRKGRTIHHPAYYPVDNDIEIYAKNIEMEPLDDRYTKARLTIEFGVLDYDPLQPYYFNGIPIYITETIQPATEFLTLDNTDIYWGDNTAISDVEAPAKIIRMLEWSYTLHQVPFAVSSSFTGAIFGLPGKINDRNMYSELWKDYFPARTLLAGNPTINHTITSAGKRTMDITMTFTFRNIEWNRFPRVRAGASGGDLTWEYLYASTGASGQIKPYEEADFSGFIL